MTKFVPFGLLEGFKPAGFLTDQRHLTEIEIYPSDGFLTDQSHLTEIEIHPSDGFLMDFGFPWRGGPRDWHRASADDFNGSLSRE